MTDSPIVNAYFDWFAPNMDTAVAVWRAIKNEFVLQKLKGQFRLSIRLDKIVACLQPQALNNLTFYDDATNEVDGVIDCLQPLGWLEMNYLGRYYLTPAGQTALISLKTDQMQEDHIRKVLGEYAKLPVDKIIHSVITDVQLGGRDDQGCDR